MQPASGGAAMSLDLIWQDKPNDGVSLSPAGRAVKAGLLTAEVYHAIPTLCEACCGVRHRAGNLVSHQKRSLLLSRPVITRWPWVKKQKVEPWHTRNSCNIFPCSFLDRQNGDGRALEPLAQPSHPPAKHKQKQLSFVLLPWTQVDRSKRRLANGFNALKENMES